MKNEINEKMFFIVEKIKYSHSKDTYTIHDSTMYDLTTAVKKLLALDTLNEDRKRTEAMITDPVYEGKSMQGMIDLAKKGFFKKGSKILYAHLGGAPAINGYSYTYRNG